jgi:hypothetical protein
MKLRYIVSFGLTIFTLAAFVALIGAYCEAWDAAVFATLFVGFIAADVVVWQGYLIKRQLAFSTYLELDKEWNSDEMIKARKAVHAPTSEKWDISRLEGILEFFEKVASMFKLSGDIPFVYESTLGWYAAQYFLFARQHGQVDHLRTLWQDNVYTDVENFYSFYVRREAGRSRKSQQAWEAKRLSTEDKFWEQERRD